MPCTRPHLKHTGQIVAPPCPLLRTDILADQYEAWSRVRKPTDLRCSLANEDHSGRRISQSSLLKRNMINCLSRRLSPVQHEAASIDANGKQNDAHLPSPPRTTACAARHDPVDRLRVASARAKTDARRNVRLVVFHVRQRRRTLHVRPGRCMQDDREKSHGNASACDAPHGH